eukprot:2721054-Pyramimonas_sp.AAC.1
MPKQKSTTTVSPEWSFVTVLRKDANWAEADPGAPGQPHDKSRCNFCGKEFACLLARVRGHIAGVKGFDVRPCAGPTKRDDETLLSYENRQQQFQAAKERCKDSIDEKAETL